MSISNKYVKKFTEKYIKRVIFPFIMFKFKVENDRYMYRSRPDKNVVYKSKKIKVSPKFLKVDLLKILNFSKKILFL